MRLTLVLCIVAVIFQSCVAGKAGFSPDKKFAAADLHKDYNLFQSVLEESQSLLVYPQRQYGPLFQLGEGTNQGFFKRL